MTLPAPLTKDEYILFSHFVELFLPLCELTNAMQGDKITSPLLIPTLLETFVKIHELRPMPHYQAAIDFLIQDFARMAKEYIQDISYQMGTVLHPYIGPKWFRDFGIESLQWTLPPRPAIIVPPILQDLNFNINFDDSNYSDGHSNDNATRKKKRNAEKEIRLHTPINTSRMVAQAIAIDLLPMAIPSFVDVNANAASTLPEVCTKFQSIVVEVVEGESMIQKWKRLSEAGKMAQKSEWTRYLEEVQNEANSNKFQEDPSTFWKQNKTAFPHLYNYARLVFCRPTSTGSVERLFSFLGNISSRNRSSKSATNMEIATVFKEESIKRTATYPKKIKHNKNQRKGKKSQVPQPVGSFDPSNYMTDAEALNTEDFNIEREAIVLNADCDNDDS